VYFLLVLAGAAKLAVVAGVEAIALLAAVGG
jgi:hypothetical protein